MPNTSNPPDQSGRVHPSAQISPDCRVHPDATIGPDVILRGSRVGAGVTIGARSVITNCELRADVTVEADTVLTDMIIYSGHCGARSARGNARRLSSAPAALPSPPAHPAPLSLTQIMTLHGELNRHFPPGSTRLRWMNTPHPALGGLTPEQLLSSADPSRADQLLAVLRQMPLDPTHE